MKRSVWLTGIATALAAGVLVAGVLQLAGAHSPQPPPTEDTCAGLTDEGCDAAS